MILNLIKNTPPSAISELQQRLTFMGFTVMRGEENNTPVLALVKGIDKTIDIEKFNQLPHVESIIPATDKYILASRQFHPSDTQIKIGSHSIGSGSLTIMAGSCSVESEEQIFTTAKIVSQHGATILRGGAFKPRTSPYDFQGLGEIGLVYLSDAAKAHNMLCVSEVMDSADVELLEKYVDILQVGARNMQNFSLLKAVGRSQKPVLLKRGLSATYHDLLMAAEYILSEGNPNIILCERGIRTYETFTRNTLDIAAVPVLKSLSHLPVIVDPSHGVGIREFISPLAYAAIAAGADGLIIEVHPTPDKALSDAKQTISPEHFASIMKVLPSLKQLT